MKPWLRSRVWALIAFALIVALVIGGLGWATITALRLEKEQIEARVEAHVALALWRLDSHVFTTLAREANRPYRDYRVTAPPPMRGGKGAPRVDLFQLTPADSTKTPAWLGSRYLVARSRDWKSPQILGDALGRALGVKIEHGGDDEPPMNGESFALLARLVIDNYGALPQYANSLPQQMLEQTEANEYPEKQQAQAARPQSANAPIQQRVELDTRARNLINDALTNRGQSANYPATQPSRDPAVVGPMLPLWIKDGDAERLIVMRTLEIASGKVHDIGLIEWNALAPSLRQEVQDLLPDMKLRPITEGTSPSPDRTMSALPVELDPGPAAFQIGRASVSPLRVGLGLSWFAAALALIAVGFGGWSLLNLSERRIRFVSAVTHELRTPLTTLRLYLDMLSSGMVRDEARQAEYLHTLNAEAGRLNLLVGNVLDFSRLENQRPRLSIAPVQVADLLSQVHDTWQARCRNAGKELIVANDLEPTASMHTDITLVAQILGNFIDNACKYSQGASDQRIWLRARQDSSGRLQLEVEDRGKGVSPAERRVIFRPFRRGQSENVGVGGVGLGLALAQKWARLLGSSVSVGDGAENSGACFRLHLPPASKPYA